MDLTTEERDLLGRFRTLGEEARTEILSLAERLSVARKKQKPSHYRDLIGEQVVRGEELVGHDEVLTDLQAARATPDRRELPLAVGVADVDADAARLDLDLVPGRRDRAPDAP